MKHHVTNFLTGTVGSAITFLQTQPAIDPIIPDDTKKTIIVTVVSIVGGLVTTILTKLFKKWFKVKSTKNNKKMF